jgi:hypothetical protein
VGSSALSRLQKKRRYEAMAKARWITGRVSVASLSPRLNGATVSLRG